MLLPGGMFGASRALGLLLQRPLRAVEATIPDHDTVPAAAPAVSAKPETPSAVAEARPQSVRAG